MSALNSTFEKEGYVLLPEVFTTAEIDALQKVVRELCSDTETEKPLKWGLADGVSRTKELWSVISHQTLLDAVQETLGVSDIRYTEQSAIKVWKKQKASGWHRDCVDERFNEGLEWKKNIDYRIVRVAIYIQPKEHLFEWGAIPHSHKREFLMTEKEQSIWQERLAPPRIPVATRLPYLPASNGRLWVRTKTGSYQHHPPAEPMWIKTCPGDVVLFDPRLLHVGGDVLQSKLALLFSYGAPNHMSKRHMMHYSNDWYSNTKIQQRQEFVAFLKRKNLLLA